MFSEVLKKVREIGAQIRSGQLIKGSAGGRT